MARRDLQGLLVFGNSGVNRHNEANIFWRSNHPPAMSPITATSTSQPLNARESAWPVLGSAAGAIGPACGVDSGAPCEIGSQHPTLLAPVIDKWGRHELPE